MKSKLVPGLLFWLTLIYSGAGLAASGQFYRDAEKQQAAASRVKVENITSNTESAVQERGGRDVYFFVEVQTDIFSSNKMKYSVSNEYEGVYLDTKSTTMNMNGGLRIGIAFSELDAQMGFIASRETMDDAENTSFGAGIRLPLSKDWVQPYVEIDVLYSMIETNLLDDDISGLGFAVEGGFKFNFTNNSYIKAGLSYGYLKFEKDFADTITLKAKSTSVGVNVGVGYKF